MNADALWYLARGSGLVSLVLLTVTVVLGVATRAGAPAFGLPRFAVTAVHRSASLLCVTFLAVHVITLVLDPYAQIRLVDTVLPFGSGYRPFWVGLGTVAFDLVVALVITSLLRARLGPRTWRAVHWAAYAAWPVAVWHGLGAGSDAGEPWTWVIVGGCVLAFVGALGWRISENFGARVTPAPPTRIGVRT